MMQWALELASYGAGYVSPNPLVGCVIVSPGGRIIGEGYHTQYGAAHAEVEAIRMAERLGHSLEGATAYVILEPCAHHGKTPPCADLLIEKKIARCVIAMEDPYHEVQGRGIQKLKDAGITVQVGMLGEQAQELNRFFTKYVTTGDPYITLKIASTLDGRIALKSGKSKWITSEASRKEVHHMRSAYDAVMVASATVIADDPALTVRMIEGRDPKRIILDASLRIPDTAKVVTDDNAANTILLVSEAAIKDKKEKVKALESRGIRFLASPSKDGHLDLASTFHELGKLNVTSILVEPGTTLATVLLEGRNFDELVLFLAPVVLGDDARSGFGQLHVGDLASLHRLKLIESHAVETSDDLMIRYRKH